MYENQEELQTNAQRTSLKIHAVYEKVENVILYPFRWLGLIAGQTDKFEESESSAKPIS